MSYHTEEETLGIALPAVGGAISTVGGLFSGSKDPGRLATNAKMYNAVLSGTTVSQGGQLYTPTQALEFLRTHAISGAWATEVARKDAETKYKAALAFLAKKPTTPTSVYAQPKPISVVPSVGGPVIAGLSTGPLVIAGIAAAALFALTSDKKRR